MRQKATNPRVTGRLEAVLLSAEVLGGRALRTTNYVRGEAGVRGFSVSLYHPRPELAIV